MADITINELPASIPSNAAAIPFSQDGTTYKVSPSSILQGAGPVFISGPGPGTRSYNIDSNPALEIQNSRYGNWPGTSFLNAATASNLMLGNTETGTKLMFGQFSTAYSWIQNRNLVTNGNQILILQPEGGTVGIGLKSLPASTLHVNGTITATGLQVPGTVVQVICNVKSDISATNSTSFIDIPGLSASITPKSVLNKVLFTGNVFGSSNNNAFVRIMRSIGGGAYSQVYTNTGSIGSRTPVSFGDFYMVGSPGIGAGKQNTSVFLDTTNTTAEVIYKLQYAGTAGSTMSINCTYYNTDAYFSAVGASSITLMEIAG